MVSQTAATHLKCRSKNLRENLNIVISCAAFGCENRWIPKKELLPGQQNISFHQ